VKGSGTHDMNVESVVSRLAAAVERRFYGKYRGFVVDSKDPEHLGRLKLTVPSVLGQDVVTGWAMPCVPYGGAMDLGVLFVPAKDAGVWVEFEEGDLEFPIWVGTFWSKPGGKSELPKPNAADGSEESAVQDPPTRKIIKTAKGHTLQFEDADGDEMVILVEATDGHRITMNADGISIADATGNVIEMTPSALRITSKVPFTVDATGQPIVLIGKTIDLNKG
jgi:Type VI secretion system/phage-baseplate injector OB domain